MAHITVELYDELSEDPIKTLAPRGADVSSVLPETTDEGYPLLRLVDPYGDTIFSSYQMQGLIPELDRLLAVTEAPILRDMIALAELCRSRRSFLVFIGD